MENPFLLSSPSTAEASTGAGRGRQAAFAVQVPFAYDGFDLSLVGGTSGEVKLYGNCFKKCFSLT